tara:strand:- start:457 stop:834 length:378 start_codon:yes stop_codon:yes gene_type:complete
MKWVDFEGILVAIAIVIGLYFVFSNDWIEYECDEYITGNKVELYKKGGVIRKYADGTSFSWEMEIIDGDKFKSYIWKGGEYSYKLNLDDLTYYHRVGDKSGQCRKVGFFASLINKPYSSQAVTYK